jgi:N-acetyl-1-D-myo-inositol-2-amino-2-deoxy-alpha-D-glucopyranoside deacetylase/mycothiol S-conjugate amidase
MLSDKLTLMTVHAHPDDESISTGGILAKYSAEGVRTVLVTCTKGELGEVEDPLYKPPRPGMGICEIREKELAAAIRILGIGAYHNLNYKDSGMAGTEGNHDPEAFIQADITGAAHRLAGIIRRERPQVIVTYDENGIYGHPDHIMANRVTQKAFAAASDPNVILDRSEPPWQPDKLYFFALPKARLSKFRRAAEDSGNPEAAPPALMGTPEDEITTRIDVTRFLDQKFKAVFTHASQFGPSHRFHHLPDEIKTKMFGIEHFVCIFGCGQPEDEKETDLFQGLR